MEHPEAGKPKLSNSETKIGSANHCGTGGSVLGARRRRRAPPAAAADAGFAP